jgi:iduronate 2-sulfatase
MTLITLLAALAPVRAINAAETPSRPNVLLICVDDLKPLLGCYGDRFAQTPNLDRLAARSLRFDRAYCNQAVCSPSRNALLCGLRPQTLGIYDLATNFRKSRPDAVTLPQHFKLAGYHTAALGKVFHVGHGNGEDAASWSTPPWKANVVSYALPASKAKEGLTREEALFANRPANNLPKGAAFEAADVPDEAYPDGALALEAVQRLESAAKKADEPFFLAVGFLKPHLPFVAPQRYWDKFDRAAVPLATFREPPAGAPDYAPQFGGELRNYRDIPNQGALPDDLQRTLVHGYYAATSYMDAQLGKVLDAVDRLGLSKNTIIVLWGDHGWHLGDHGMWCKHTNYEQATRIPLLIAAPGLASNTATSALVESVDIYPTLCELAGLTPPPGLDGQSAVSVLRDPATAHRERALHVYPRSTRDNGPLMGRAIRTARYRLVEWKKPGAAPDSAELELYDYETDPLETKNLASAQPEVVRTLRAILAKEPEAKPQIVPAPRKPAAEPKPMDRDALFNRKDTNQDGQLSREEFLKGQPDPDKAPERFTRFDADKNNTLSRNEFVSQGKQP